MASSIIFGPFKTIYHFWCRKGNWIERHSKWHATASPILNRKYHQIVCWPSGGINPFTVLCMCTAHHKMPESNVIPAVKGLRMCGIENGCDLPYKNNFHIFRILLSIYLKFTVFIGKKRPAGFSGSMFFMKSLSPSSRTLWFKRDGPLYMLHHDA